MDSTVDKTSGPRQAPSPVEPGRLRRFVGRLARPEPGQFEDRRANAGYLVLYAALLVLPALFAVTDDGEALCLAGRRLPPGCVSRELFGTTCPGCGLGRSFVEIAHGRLGAAMAQQRVGLVLYTLFLGQAVFRAWCLWRGPRPVPHGAALVHHWSALVMIALLIGNWIAGFWLGGNGL